MTIQYILYQRGAGTRRTADEDKFSALFVLHYLIFRKQRVRQRGRPRVELVKNDAYCWPMPTY
jgi:hypothetical protein